MSDFKGSLSSPVFLRSAEELLERLSRLGSRKARELTREAEALVAEFRHWLDERPAPERKVAKIQALFDVTRRSMELLAEDPPKSGRRIDSDEDDDD